MNLFNRIFCDLYASVGPLTDAEQIKLRELLVMIESRQNGEPAPSPDAGDAAGEIENLAAYAQAVEGVIAAQIGMKTAAEFHRKMERLLALAHRHTPAAPSAAATEALRDSLVDVLDMLEVQRPDLGKQMPYSVRQIKETLAKSPAPTPAAADRPPASTQARSEGEKELTTTEIIALAASTSATKESEQSR